MLENTMHSSILNFSRSDKETQMRPCVLSTQTDLLSQKHFLNQFFFIFFLGGGAKFTAAVALTVASQH